MTKVLEIRDMVIRIYKGYESYFRIIFKFLVAFFVFGYVNSNLGYFPVLNNMGIRLVLSLICGIVPSSIFVLLVAIVTLLHLYRLSLVMMLLAFVVFVVFLLLVLFFDVSFFLSVVSFFVLFFSFVLLFDSFFDV